MVYSEEQVPSQLGKVVFITGANTGIGYEFILQLEDVHGVVVKADYEAAKHIQTIGIDTLDRGQHVFLQVLRFQGFLQAFRVRRFDADEQPRETGIAEQGQQLMVLSQIDRRLGAEGERIVVLFLVLAKETH